MTTIPHIEWTTTSMKNGWGTHIGKFMVGKYTCIYQVRQRGSTYWFEWGDENVFFKSLDHAGIWMLEIQNQIGALGAAAMRAELERTTT